MSQLGLTQTQAEDFLSSLSPFGEGNAIRLALADPAGDEAFKKAVLETYERYGTSQTWDNTIGVKPHTGGDQIHEQGRTDTGGNQIAEQGKTDTGGNQIAEQGQTDTGGVQIPERIDNTHITPLPNQITLDDIAYLSENKNNIKNGWNQGSFNSPEESLQKHYEKHGKEIGADSVEQYRNKAEEFEKNLKGARTAKVRGATDNVTRYYKNGKYLDKTADGKIISFGKQ